MQNRKSNLLINHIDPLRFAFKKVQKNHPFYLDAVVIMPDHCHMMMTFPEGDKNYPLRLSLIKSSFSIQIKMDENISDYRKKKRERGIWQPRYWEYSSIHRFIRQGILTEGWGCNDDFEQFKFGE